MTAQPWSSQDSSPDNIELDDETVALCWSGSEEVSTAVQDVWGGVCQGTRLSVTGLIAFAGQQALEMFTIGLDTLASLGVTNCLELFGGRPLLHDVEYEVKDWSSGTTTIDARGKTAFGTMLYSKSASGTILCAFDMVKTWMLEWVPGKLECVATHRGLPGVRLRFTASERSRLLTGRHGVRCASMMCSRRLSRTC